MNAVATETDFKRPTWFREQLGRHGDLEAPRDPRGSAQQGVEAHDARRRPSRGIDRGEHHRHAWPHVTVGDGQEHVIAAADESQRGYGEGLVVVDASDDDRFLIERGAVVRDPQWRHADDAAGGHHDGDHRAQPGIPSGHGAEGVPAGRDVGIGSTEW